MNKMRNGFKIFLAVGLMFFGLSAQANAQISRSSQRQVNDILRRVNVQVDNFRYGLDSEFRRASNNRNGQSDENEIRSDVDALQNDLNNFQQKFDARRESSDDVQEILTAAKNIDDFVYRRQFSANLQRNWTNTRALFDQLASQYGISANWSSGSQYPNDNRYPQNNRNPNGNYPNGNYPNNNRYPNSNSPRGGAYGNNLTGTYQLDTSRSENSHDIAARAINDIDTQKRDDARRDLEEKLSSPTTLAIDVRGNQVTLASTRAPQISFTADGQDRNETLPDGRVVRLRTTLRGQELTVSNVGGDNDYTVTFTPIENGRSLKVTRRITTDYLRQTIFAESTYNKTNQTARLDVYNNTNSGNNYPNGNYPNNNYPNGNYPSGSYPPTARNGRNGQFVVPSGTILTGTLDQLVSTKVSQNNDRFRMTVTAPNQYRGAVIEGYVSGITRSGKVSGRSQMTFNFETIRLPNSNTYDFAGFLQSVTDTNGKTVQVDTEGAAKGSNQTTQTATRGAIGAGIGAIIGAIAGGGKGAAIGAILGGGAGAGSVFIQGADDLELPAGSSITVQSSSPTNR